MEALWGESVPCLAECVDDLVVVVEQPVAEVALAQMEPERSVFALLADRSLAPDEELPDTGVGIEGERALSAPFIATERYGTRSSSYLALEPGRARFVEREFAAGGAPLATREYEW